MFIENFKGYHINKQFLWFSFIITENWKNIIRQNQTNEIKFHSLTNRSDHVFILILPKTEPYTEK